MGGDRPDLDGDQDRRPRSISLIDLMALVAGVAVVLLFNDILGNSWIAAARVSEPWATFLRVGGFTSAAGVALATVVLVQYLRSSGNFRPAEWLLIANAMRTVHWKLVFAGGMDWAARSFGWVSQSGRFRAWYTLGMIGFLIVVASLSITRRPSYQRIRLPLLFCLPLFALWGPAILFSSELEVLWKVFRPSVPYSSLTRAAYLGLQQAPEHLLLCLPFVASIRDLTKSDRPTWTWGEWAGLGIALVTTVGGLIMIIAAHMLNFPQLPERLAHLSVSVGWWLAELALAWIAVRCLGWLWNNWISPPAIPSPSKSFV
jgi:hypothetical protein